uniref:transcription factor SRM1-like n=1 Tax=Erigeron canadensis TaxID=72917 RepID=UPI001CB95905|nr:transcription factor SRM1-like [Erigeron canadensis]XP_043607257.1 transcription factor SRM1-like [Erigeron canadensis]
MMDSKWRREQDLAFENALVANDHPEEKEGSKDWWDNIASKVPGKSVEQVKHHYELLLDDLDRIESGVVPLPCYTATSSAHHSSYFGCDHDGTSNDNYKSKASKADQERRKGVPWTEDEHRLFLVGLEEYGKGDWRSISRKHVLTRTPTQVASHAQKYFIRLNSINRERKRSSIHDITNGDTSLAPKAAITGQTNTSSVGKPSKPNHG